MSLPSSPATSTAEPWTTGGHDADPLWMATVAELRGIDVTDPAPSDVLEIGCGDGGNLLGLASAYPELRLQGVENDLEAIERGRARVTALDLDGRIQLGSDDDLEGAADYVIVRQQLADADEFAKTVRVAARAARPGGLVSLTYPVVPAATYERPGLEMARFAIEQAAAAGIEPSWSEQVRIARARVRLAARYSTEGTLHGQAMGILAARWDALDDRALYDQELTPLPAFRLTEVAAVAAEHGLRYVGELLLDDDWAHRLPGKAAQRVRDLAGSDGLVGQQVADDLVGPGVHSSLFVKSDDAQPTAEPSADGRTLYARPYPSVRDGERRSDEISAPVAQVLREHAPHVVTSDAIVADLERDPDFVHRGLLALHANGLIRVSTRPLPSDGVVAGERPRITSLVRLGLDTGQLELTGRFHMNVAIASPAQRALLGLADGTRDLDALRRDLPGSLDTGGSPDLDETLRDLNSLVATSAAFGLFDVPEEG